MTAFLECSNIHKYFGGLSALIDVSFSLPQGEILGIIGPNGAGKTTLFNVIAGSLKPNKGTVRFRGRDITDLGPDRICRLGIARTYQLVRPFASLTVLENALVGVSFGRSELPPRSERIGHALNALEFVGLAGKAHQKAQELTLVDKKHLEIARSLATNPEIILLDEVVSGLTPTECTRVIETIRGIQRRGVTVIMIEHVLKVVVELCRTVMVLNYGSLIARGSPSEVVSDPLVIEAYLGNAAVAEGGHA
ncbi:MAG: ABC transporter ATP-binding protein [Desulfomonile sp.]|nr:ABC transporter ATP-binding protein [Desulfomonile sp.]